MRPRPLRLLVAFQPLGGGVAAHAGDLVRSLAARGYEIDVACPRSANVRPAFDSLERVRVHEIQPHREPALADARSLATLLRLAGRVDVVHGHSAKAGFLVRLAAMLRGRRGATVFTPHGWSWWAADGAEARLYLQLERLAARWCRSIVTISGAERAAGLAARVGRPAQYRVIPNGIDLERFGRPPEPVPGRVVFVTRLDPPKRVDLAVRALAEVRGTFPEAELQLVGDGSRRAEAERLVAALGVGDAVRFLGVREDVPDILSRASCAVLASDYEGCPFAVLEAMAAGVPVVATAVGGLPELLEHGRTGLLVPPGDAAALAAALRQLLADPQRARRIGEAARAEARRRFSHERMIADLVDLYEEVAENRNGGLPISRD
jgi:glycosyltransferase involved in cell wall biosynthesis